MGGNESALLIFEVRDSSGVPLSPNQTAIVAFTTQAGPNGGEFINPSTASPDSLGQIHVAVGSGSKPGVLQVVAQIVIGTRIIQATPVYVTIAGGLPDQAHFSVSSNVTNNFVWDSTNSNQIGTITIQAGDKFGNPAIVGTPIYFSTNAGIIDAVAQLDASGKATANWYGGKPAPKGGDTTRVSASTVGVNGQPVTDTLKFEFGKITTQRSPGAASINLISISSQKLGVRGAGSNESAKLVFQVIDSSGNPVTISNRATVSFSFQDTLKGGEYLSVSSAQTDTAGYVSVSVNSGTKAGVVKIIASIGSTIRTQATLTIVGGAPVISHFSITSDVSSNIDWPKTGTKLGTVTVQVGDTSGNPVQPNTAVYFQATAGMITGTGFTDANGSVKVEWIAGDPAPHADGSAIVYASTLDENGIQITKSLGFTFTGAAVTGGEARSIAFISTSSQLLNVDQAAGPQSTQMIFEVRDSSGNPVNQKHQVTVHFILASAPTGSYLSPEYAQTDPQTGQVHTILAAGTVAGVAQILVQLTTSSGKTVISKPTLITISGGLPDNDHFSIGMAQHNIPALYFINLKTGVTVLVGDKYSNPVRKGTAVYFSTMSGVIDNNTALTDESGLASVGLISGAPWPDAGTPWVHPIWGRGYSTVKAVTVDDKGIQISKEEIFLFSSMAYIQVTDPTQLVNGEFQVPKGGSISIDFDVTDDNINVNSPHPMGNPLSVGTTFAAINGFKAPANSTSVQAPQIDVSSTGPLGDNIGDPLSPVFNIIPGVTRITLTITDGTPGGSPMWAGYAGISVSYRYGSNNVTATYVIPGVINPLGL